MESNSFNENTVTDSDNSLQNIASPSEVSKDQPNMPLPCPRCGELGTESFCRRCGLDLVAFYQNANVANQEPHVNANFTNNQYSYNTASHYAPYTQYSYQMSNKKPKASTIISMVVMVVLSVAMIFSIPFLFFGAVKEHKTTTITDNSTTSQVSPKDEIIPHSISLSEYNDIKLDMSYAHVSAIIGCDGVLSDRGTLPDGTTYYTYTWYGELNQDVLVHITFKDDVVSEIMEIGLLGDQSQK